MSHDLNAPNSEKPSRAFVNLSDLQQFLSEVLDYIPSERTIIQWRQRGCPHLRLGYRCIRYSPEAVLGWLMETRQVQSRPSRRTASPGRPSRRSNGKASRDEIMAELQAVAAQGRR